MLSRRANQAMQSTLALRRIGTQFNVALYYFCYFSVITEDYQELIEDIVTDSNLYQHHQHQQVFKVSTTICLTYLVSAPNPISI